MEDDEEECGNTPGERTWPVCALPLDHVGDHESADFIWKDGDREATVKLIICD